MRTRTSEVRRGVTARHALLCLLATFLLAASAAAAPLPRPVSPGAASHGSITEARCPTFSWSGVAGATGYRLAVFRVAEDENEEPTLIATAQVDGDARSFTPAVDQCLERGERYAWTVAAISGDLDRSSSEVKDTSDDDLSWAPALVFEVEGAPSSEELERAIATLRRHLDSASRDGEDVAAARNPAPRSRSRTDSERRASPRRLASAASTPTPGAASLAVSNQIHLANASDFFKDDKVFLWDDATGNIALGREALASVSFNATNNTAVGRGALRNTAGDETLLPLGSYNTAVGDRALFANSTGRRNTASGAYALHTNTTGVHNTATGADALRASTTGHNNTASGYAALRGNLTGAYNTASGAFALFANTTGTRNTATGFEALRDNTSGSGNTATGLTALRTNTTGTRNTATGGYALQSNSTGSSNTASGFAALHLNTTGHTNTASGAYALHTNTTGVHNTATGADALRTSTTGHNNTASGYAALKGNLTGAYNTASGAFALFANTTGTRNTASGAYALQLNTTGYSNTASGYNALRGNLTGAYNTATGAGALLSNSTGTRNSASGVSALQANTTGHRNTASGLSALHFNTTGYKNTASGAYALLANTTGRQNTATGHMALKSNTTGVNNTASGSDALYDNTTGSGNTAIGFEAGRYSLTANDSIFINNLGTDTDDATIKIGTQGTQTSTFIAGISGVTVTDAAAVLVDANGQLGTVLSSREVKRDISTLAPLAERLLALRPVSFRYRPLTVNGQTERDTPLEYGLVAEEVAEVFPELVIYDQQGKPQTVKYHLLGSLLLRALQEQQEELEAQDAAALRQREELASQRAVADRQRAELTRLREDQRALTRRLAALESRSRR